jgi:hypothetical protein
LFVASPASKIRADLSPSFHPHSSLSIFARCQLGVSRFSGRCNLDVALWFRLADQEPALSRSHPNSAILLACILSIRTI